MAKLVKRLIIDWEPSSRSIMNTNNIYPRTLLDCFGFIYLFIILFCYLYEILAICEASIIYYL